LLPVHGQSSNFTLVYSFSRYGGSRSSLILSGNTLYGTTTGVPGAQYGTLFSVNTDGSGFTNLVYFPPFSLSASPHGSVPEAGLVLSGQTLFGTSSLGGPQAGLSEGTVFAVNTNSLACTNLLVFGNTTNTNMGSSLNGGLVLSGNMLYGTAVNDEPYCGQVFGVTTNGLGFTNLHAFSPMVSSTNSDGAYPYASLILSGGTLYGTAKEGGAWGDGTVFAVNTDGSGFTNLHSFGGSDGSQPICALVLAGNTLYGTTYYGGSANCGTVFAVNTDGSGFTNLYSFTALVSSTNSDGAMPCAGLILSGNTLYGTAGSGGTGGGTVFAINTDGSGFTILHTFAFGTDGGWPQGALMLSGSTLYGTTYDGGVQDNGTVFALILPAPTLAIAPAGNQIVISWPTSPTNYVMQVACDLSSGSWTNITSGIATNGNNFVLTNAMSSQAAYFRLQRR